MGLQFWINEWLCEFMCARVCVCVHEEVSTESFYKPNVTVIVM